MLMRIVAWLGARMAKAGRPSKGPRRRVEGYVPESLAPAYRSAKEQSPYRDDTDFVAAIIAEYLGKPELRPQPTRVQQEVLDIPA